MEHIITIIIGTLLYWCPRGTGWAFLVGTDTEDENRHWIFRIPKNAELPWAVGLSMLVWWATGNDWAWILVPLLIAGEAPTWSKWWPNNETVEPRYWIRMLKLSLRGCLVFNPLMGPIDFGIYQIQNKLPGNSRIYSELLSGAITTTIVLIIFN